MGRQGGCAFRKNHRHFPQPLGSDQPQRAQDVALVLDEQFGRCWNAKESLRNRVFADLARDAGLGETFANGVDLGAVRRREQHLHIGRATAIIVPFSKKATTGNAESNPGETLDLDSWTVG